MKPTRNIVAPNSNLWKTKGSVWYQKNDDEKLANKLAQRYKHLLDADIEDYKIGIQNARTKREMEEIEKELSK